MLLPQNKYYCYYPYTASPSYQHQSKCAPQKEVGQNARKMIENFSYGLNDQIGKGFSSKVYKGKNESNGECVAVKVIEKSLLKTPLHHALLKSEIEALSQLDCEYIMKLYKVFQTQNNTYLITEFCDGGDLGGKLTKQGKYTEQSVMSIMHGVVIAYKQLKDHGIIHRDIKPANILLSNTGVPKLADFGFATTPNSPPMLPNVNVGSPLYMSPQALKNNKYSEKSDIWAIGVTAYEILFGQVPWQASSEKELAQRMLTVPVSFPSNVKVSEHCKDFIRRCLVVDESRRSSIEEMERHAWLSSATRLPPPSSQSMMTPAIKQYQKTAQKVINYADEQFQSPLGDAQNKIVLNNNVAPATKPKMDSYVGKENSAQKKRESYLESIQKKPKTTYDQTSASSVLPKRDPQAIFASAFQNTSLEQSQQGFPVSAGGCSSAAKKLYSQIPSQQPLLGRQNQTRQSKQLNHSYQFEEALQTQSNEVFQSERSNMEDEEFKKNDYIVMSQLNFCRYLYRVASLIDKHKLFSTDLLREKMLFFVAKNIMIKIYKLKEMVSGQNVFQLPCFSQYRGTSQFEKISQAVNTYFAKYSLQFTTTWLSMQNQNTRSMLTSDKKFDAVFDENFTEFESFYIILNSVLRSAIHEIDRELNRLIQDTNTQNQQLPIDVEGGVVLLDYLVTYYQLSSLILDAFNDYPAFALQSKIEQIAEGKPVRLTYGHFVEIKNKIQLLEI